MRVNRDDGQRHREAAFAFSAFADWASEAVPAQAVTGPGLRKWAPHLPANVKPLDESLWYPEPESLLQLGLARYLRGERDDVWNMAPIYLRPSAAEEKWKDRSAPG